MAVNLRTHGRYERKSCFFCLFQNKMSVLHFLFRTVWKMPAWMLGMQFCKSWPEVG